MPNGRGGSLDTFTTFTDTMEISSITSQTSLPIEPPRVDSETTYIAYTDGSGTTATKPCGIGVVLFENDALVAECSASLGLGTNNIAEVRAIGRALAITYARARSRDVCLTIRSDSEFALGAVAPESRWKIKASEALRELVHSIRLEARRWPRLALEHVYGHTGIVGNERADVLAGLARKRQLK